MPMVQSAGFGLNRHAFIANCIEGSDGAEGCGIEGDDDLFRMDLI